MKKKCYIVLIGLLLCCVYGCKEKKDVLEKRQTEFQRIEFEEKLLDVTPGGAFVVADNGDFFVVENWSDICRYSVDGMLLRRYEECGEVSALCLYGDQLFFYTYEDELKSLSLETGNVMLVTERLWFTEMTNLVTTGKSLYAFGVSEESGQAEVVLKRVDPENGSIENVDTETGIRAIYGSADGHLYFCTEVSGGTYLYSYQEETGECVKLYDLTNRPESEYPVQNFVCEQGVFVYTTLSKSMVVMSLDQEKATIIPMNGTLVYGKDMVCATGNIVYQVFCPETTSMQREKIYLGDTVLEPVEDASCEFITVHDSSDEDLDIKRIKADSGIRTKFVVGETYTDEFLTEVMAGNSEVDIYVLTMSSKEAQLLKEKGIYTPLNSSEVIQEYQKTCFPYISEGMTTESGDIWMLPIGIDSLGIWYVEKNMDQFQLSTNWFCTMKNFIELSKMMIDKLENSEYRAYVTPMSIGNNWIEQYDSVYCDFANGVANYDTEVYKVLYENLWSDWKVYGQNMTHPYFKSWLTEKEEYGVLKDHPCYNPERVVYKYSFMSEHLKYGDFNGWRVLPSPVISEDVQDNNVTITGLVINPYSSKKELAMDYLETVAENPLGIYGGAYTNTTSFLFEDINLYESFYDFSIPAVRDLYKIFEDGKLNNASYPYYFSIVYDYQEGRLTLDEAIERLQRETEMWLNE